MHDGYNEFAKVFYFYKEVPIQDERWKEFLRYAQEQKDHVYIEKLREIFGDTLLISQETQNNIDILFHF
ncbi:hypothetical protein NWE61_06840 [Mycoplasmopsis felis]|uniref:hypothetical protein n=1 Tax=Mycoplasmopsis felis TaxID=33923 RepID=UPI0021E038A1|nr:hypothetical protein [Mycoplasmopsis felis]MCU9934761.1 hypothetical protein [Mycoplasmopsis felis]